MVFRSDRQRKGFFSNKGRSRSQNNPRILKKSPKNCKIFLKNKIRKNIREGRPRAQDQELKPLQSHSVRQERQDVLFQNKNGGLIKMVMNFKTRKRDKRVFPVEASPQRSNITPEMMNQPPGRLARVREVFRRRFRPTGQELAEQRGVRLQREAESLKEERRRARQLELEANIEAERERIASKTRRASARLKEIDVERRERRLAPIKRRARQIFEAGKTVSQVALGPGEPTPPPRRPRRKARRAPREQVGAFGIIF